MLRLNIILLLFRNRNCFYATFKGFAESSISETTLRPEIKPKVYYFFELENGFYLAYFDNTSEHHENPFILLLMIPEAQDKEWSDPDSCQLLTTAFDEFYKNSAFLSLLPSEQNQKYYRILATIKNVTIKGEFYLGNNGTSFLAKGFALQRFIDCVPLLNSVKIGTLSSNHFYKVEDILYGLFVTFFIEILLQVQTLPFRLGRAI